VSPRTSSQHSQTSDKASKAGGTPRRRKTILPNIAADPEAPNLSASLAAGISPQGANANSHAAKVARMEVGASDGLSGGVPARIDEGLEPD
jgi:hypothetical protein